LTLVLPVRILPVGSLPERDLRIIVLLSGFSPIRPPMGRVPSIRTRLVPVLGIPGPAIPVRVRICHAQTLSTGALRSL
jgi:hypothetical protein